MTKGEILIYKNFDGNIKIEVRLEDETVWLTQDQMAALFGKVKSTINEHIKNIFKEGELEESLVLKKFGNSEFQNVSSTKKLKTFTLPVSTMTLKMKKQYCFSRWFKTNYFGQLASKRQLN